VTLAFPLNWQGSAAPEDAVPDATLDALEQFAEIIEASNLVATFEEITQFSNGVEEAIRLLREDDSLAQSARHYVSLLLREVRDVLENEDLQDGFDFLQARARLWAAMGAAAGQSRTPDKWRNAAQTYLLPIVTGIGSNVAIAGGGVALRVLGVGP
jgi:hypothetical protein